MSKRPVLAIIALLPLVAVARKAISTNSKEASCDENPAKCLTPWDEAGYFEYVSKYNPFNGTAAAFLYNAADARKWTAILADSSNYAPRNVTPRTPTARENIFQCIAYGFGGFGCMYDESAGIRTANCGYRCSTYVYKGNGVYWGYVKDESSRLPSRADRCCFNHDIALHNRGNPISAFSWAACPIHRAMYNCMVAKRTSWGKKIASRLVNCMGC